MLFHELTSMFLRDNYLFGIPLEDMYGNKMGEGLLEHYIRASIQQTQRQFQITIEPITVTDEVHDYYSSDFNSWAFMQLYKRPLIDVVKLEMQFGDRKMFEIPKDWIRKYQIAGQIQLFPVSGSTGGMILNSQGSFMPLLVGTFSNAPSLWKVTYRAGLEDIPDDLVEYIMKRASIGILQVWGDLIIGAGIANQTISIDGLSQSIGTTQSPEFAGAGARIKSYTDDLKNLEKGLRDTYLGINMVVV